MSILSQLLKKQITWGQAASAIEAWGEQLVAKASPATQAAAGVVVSDLKQAASNAVMFADTAAGPLLAEGAQVAGAALSTFLAKYLGPLAAVESPVTQDAINNAAAALKAEIDAQATAALAALKSGTPVAAPAPATSSAPSNPAAA